MGQAQFPYNGQLHKSLNKKYDEIVIFILFYEGEQISLKKHISLMNELGFDAFSFDLRSRFDWLQKPISRDGQIGLKHCYADQITDVLNLFPNFKIVYSFSNPSASAIEAMAFRQCSDIKALICDSGPSGKLIESIFSLFQLYKNDSLLVSLTKTLLSPVAWSLKFHADVHKHLNQFPTQFPILSIRGWKDELIPPSHIDAIFEKHPQLNWKKLSLPRAGHLNGLKDFPVEYKKGVEHFINSIKTR